MSNSPRLSLLPILGLILAALISPRFAYAQLTDDDRWAVIDVTSALNRAIEQSKGGVELREKIVRRLSECSLMYGAFFKLASSSDAKKRYFQAQLSTLEVESAIAQPLPSDRYNEVIDAAKKSVAKMSDDLKGHREKELAPFLKSCKALNEVKEIKNALRELLLQ
jgi:hypothetical protein